MPYNVFSYLAQLTPKGKQMNSTRKILALAAGLAVCLSALAMPKPSEVKAAEARGDFATAETLLKQVIAEKPTSSRAHSDLGVVYAREGKTDLAAEEAATAKKLDADAAAAVEAKKVADAKASSEFITGIFGFLGALLLIWGGYALFSRYRNNKAEQEADAEEIKQKTSTLLGLAKQLEDAALIAKTATYPDTDKTTIGKRISILQKQVRDMLADIKDGSGVSSGRLSSLESNVEDAVNDATNGLSTPVTSSVSHATDDEPRIWGSPVGQNFGTRHTSRSGGNYSTPSPTIVHHYHETAPTQVAPVVVNNSGNDMLTGVLLGEMMADNHRETTVVVEREDSYSRPSRSSRDDDSYSAPSRSSRDDDDYGSSSSRSSSNDSYSSSSSSSDSYSSSSDSSSSYDSGSSSSDSY